MAGAGALMEGNAAMTMAMSSNTWPSRDGNGDGGNDIGDDDGGDVGDGRCSGGGNAGDGAMTMAMTEMMRVLGRWCSDVGREPANTRRGGRAPCRSTQACCGAGEPRSNRTSAADSQVPAETKCDMRLLNLTDPLRSPKPLRYQGALGHSSRHIAAAGASVHGHSTVVPGAWCLGLEASDMATVAWCLDSEAPWLVLGDWRLVIGQWSVVLVD